MPTAFGLQGDSLPVYRLLLHKRVGETTKVLFGCSGTFVSNDGYFLTARHCLRNANLSPTLEALSDDFDPRHQLRVFRKAKILASIDSGDLSAATEPREIEIVAIGAESELLEIAQKEVKRQFELGGQFELLSYLRELAATGFGAQNDWAIIRLSGIHQTRCLAPSKTTHNQSRIYQLGYTSLDPNLESSQFLAEAGEIIAHQFTRSSFLNTSTIAKPQSRIDLTAARDAEAAVRNTEVLRILSQPLVAASSRSTFGMSGGPTLDDNNQIIGINSAVSLNAPRLSYFNPIANIVSGVERSSKLVGSPGSKEIFNCNW